MSAAGHAPGRVGTHEAICPPYPTMRKTALFLLACIMPATVYCAPVGDRVARALAASGLLAETTMSPQELRGDFDGDGKEDNVYFIKHRETGKRGLCILRANASRCEVIGAGRKFYAAGDDLKWVRKWEVISAGETRETTFKPDGDVLGTQMTVLQNKSIRLCDEASACGIVTWRNGHYIWVHQAD